MLANERTVDCTDLRSRGDREEALNAVILDGGKHSRDSREVPLHATRRVYVAQDLRKLKATGVGFISRNVISPEIREVDQLPRSSRSITGSGRSNGATLFAITFTKGERLDCMGVLPKFDVLLLTTCQRFETDRRS